MTNWNGKLKFDRMVGFVGDNVDYYSDRLNEDDIDEVIQSAMYTMENIAMYDDTPDEYKIDDSFDLLDMLHYVCDEYIVDDIGYHIIDNNESVLHIIGLAVLKRL